MKDNFITILMVVFIFIALGFGIYTTIHCWDIPLMDRTGICAINNR